MSRRGFTLVELVVVILVGGILTSIAMNAFGGVTSTFAARSATNTFQSLHARARAYAIERGTSAQFMVDLTGDSVWVESGGTRIDIIRFAEQYNVDIQSTATSPITLCMSPRGYADTDCNSFATQTTVSFVQGAETHDVVLWPLGQIR